MDAYNRRIRTPQPTRHTRQRDRISQSVQNAKQKVNEKIDRFKERHSS
jgi:hypothetical protein